MAKISFSYFVEKITDPKTGKIIAQKVKPIIPIRLSVHRGNPSNFVNTLVDSGSDRNLFPKQWGDVLGINFRKIKPVQIIGIGNAIITAYPSPVNIWLDSKKYVTDADFSPQQQMPLLGRSGFFNLFKEITFDENNQYLHIEL